MANVKSFFFFFFFCCNDFHDLCATLEGDALSNFGYLLIQVHSLLCVCVCVVYAAAVEGFSLSLY
jgi:hypothetical protein